MGAVSIHRAQIDRDTDERWRLIKNFEVYRVSDMGRIRTSKTERLLALSQNQYGVVQVGLMRDGNQYHRSVPLLVASHFIPRPYPAFDTPVNLNGDRWDNRVANLVWRPRWFAVKYNRQFRELYPHGIARPLQDMKSGEVCENSFECAKTFGLLEEDLVTAIVNRTYVWPTYQQFRVCE